MTRERPRDRTLAAPGDVFLSIVIPAFNEASRLPGTVRESLDWCSRSVPSYEIIIVDDGSTDNTSAIAGSFAESNDHVVVLARPHLGKGAAVREGMLNAAGRYALFMDADGATPLNEAEKLLKKMEQGYAVAIGSRVVEDPTETRVVASFLRRCIRSAFARLVNLLAVPGIKDTQCGFKMFRNEPGKTLFAMQRCTGFAFDVEILYLARKLSFPIAEVPVNWTGRPGSKVNILFDSWRMFRDVVQIRLTHRSG